MVAAEAREAEVARCRDSTDASYIVKPFTRASLEAKLRQTAPHLFPPQD